MEETNQKVNSYDPEEVKEFIDQVIKKVELINEDNKEKDNIIRSLKNQIQELSLLSDENRKLKIQLQENQNRIKSYERTEETFNKAIIMAQKTSDQMRLAAHKESETIIEDAKRNANRIVNEALMKSEKIQMQANILEKNLKIYKKKIKDIVELQLSIVDDLDKIEM